MQGNDGERDNGGGRFSSPMSLFPGHSRESDLDKKDRHISKSHPVDGSNKLGTFSGVFVPTTLNVLSILMFLRFGFILGQGGVLGTMGINSSSFHLPANQVTNCRIKDCSLSPI